MRALERERWPQGASLDDVQVSQLHRCQHSDPAYVLGCHRISHEEGSGNSKACDQYVVRVWHKRLEPDFEAGQVRLRIEGDASSTVEESSTPMAVPMHRRCAWLYEAVVEVPAQVVQAELSAPQSLRRRASGLRYVVEVPDGGPPLQDGYAFEGELISEAEVDEFQSGLFVNIANVMGCHCISVDGVFGLRFAVWAPNAQCVSVVGAWNDWDGRAHCMHKRLREKTRDFTGIWELFVPFGTSLEHVPLGSSYMFKIRTPQGVDVEKIDPFAQEFEVPPKHASRVPQCDDAFRPDPFKWTDASWLAKRTSLREGNAFRREPMAIYEAHLPSWRRGANGELIGYRELAPLLVNHLRRINFNFVELLPLSHHPFDGSWGYQVTGEYGVYSPLGSPDDFKFLVDSLHAAGIGVIIDIVISHFCKDAWGLVDYDGTPTFEYSDPRESEHKSWGTRSFNFKRSEVRSFLLGSAFFWAERYHVDGFRLDAVSSMLYRNYDRKEGEWIANENGGSDNLEAISLLREFNRALRERHPRIITIAEESSAWQGVTHDFSASSGALGFDFKWDMGWMNDTLSYLSSNSRDRPVNHSKLNFRGMYMEHERWVLPLSHDEVVSGKGSLVDKMSYLDFPEFADKVKLLRALYGFQVASPGRPLLFMGGEFAQGREWKHGQSLDWHEAEEAPRSSLLTWMSDLMGVYVHHKPLHAGDDEPHGAKDFVETPKPFEWVEVDNSSACVIAFLRHWLPEAPLLFVCNFSPNTYSNYAFGVPHKGTWKVLLNSDDIRYSGNGCGPCNQSSIATGEPFNDWPARLCFDVPANTCFFLEAPLSQAAPSKQAAQVQVVSKKLSSPPPGDSTAETKPVSKEVSVDAKAAPLEPPVAKGEKLENARKSYAASRLNDILADLGAELAALDAQMPESKSTLVQLRAHHEQMKSLVTRLEAAAEAK